MSNRQILFKTLENMPNEVLVEVLDIGCTNCPALKFCEKRTRGTCQEIMLEWLENKSEVAE